MNTLDGRVAIVTGGNGGIGLGIADALAEAGADLAIVGTNAEKNASATAAVARHGRRVLSLLCSVTDEEQVITTFDEIIHSLGRVDIVVANAGVHNSSPSLDLELAEWQQVLDVNLTGSFLTMREGARRLVELGEGGSMFAVSSVAAIHGAARAAHYAASKAGTLALVRTFAVEFAKHRIRVNALLPGWTDTDLTARSLSSDKLRATTIGRTPMGRWGEPADYGATAVYLANPAHVFHTGDVVTVDGGYSVF
ncbi:MAG TPA: SDR family oxidoreductase [Acidimicrobiales bacterium]|nr:SDR family oxidoreductase [Acidimicrobiales bacterium]